jgi:hypothetical protein
MRGNSYLGEGVTRVGPCAVPTRQMARERMGTARAKRWPLPPGRIRQISAGCLIRCKFGFDGRLENRIHNRGRLCILRRKQTKRPTPIPAPGAKQPIRFAPYPSRRPLSRPIFLEDRSPVGKARPVGLRRPTPIKSGAGSPPFRAVSIASCPRLSRASTSSRPRSAARRGWPGQARTRPAMTTRIGQSTDFSANPQVALYGPCTATSSNCASTPGVWSGGSGP